jgi:hypothetical protein
MYNYLDPSLHSIANLAKVRFEQKFNIRITNFESGFDNNLHYAPTFWGKTKTHFIVCEVSNRPFPLQTKAIYVDILQQNLSVKYFVIYPNEFNISAKELQSDIDNAKLYGIGLMKIDETNNGISLQNEAISIPLNFPSSNLQLSKYNKKLRHLIEEAYSIYINGNPKHAVQELGQLIECAIKNVAIEAKRVSHYTDGFNPNLPTTAFGNIINDLIRHGILNATFLNRVRGYTEDRNNVSHRVNSITQSIRLENKLKLDFQNGLRILEELPGFIFQGRNNYKYKLNII